MGEIQLFSCHTGAAVQFVNTLAELSGATVFASDAVVGHEAQGGSWLIDTATGAVSTVPFSALGRSQWHFTLPAFAVEAATGDDLPDLPAGFDSYAVTIPAGTPEIEAFAFQFRPVSSVIIPDSVTSIGSNAFADTPLMTVTIGNSVTSIGNFAFLGTQLTEVIIPDSVTSIGEFAFVGTPLTEVLIPDSVTSIGRSAFERTPLTTVTIGNQVTSIGNGAFGQTQLTEVIIGYSVTSIGFCAFFGTQLTEVIIPDPVREIEPKAFNITTLESVVIPDSVREIGDRAFFNSQLTEVTLSKNTTLGDRVFPDDTTIILRNPDLTATLTLDDPALTAGETATVTIAFTEAVSDFTLDDLTADNGTLTGLTTTDNITFTATFTPTADLDDDTNVITLANTYTDTEGSIGTAATSANYTIDTTPIFVPGKTLFGTFRKDTLTGMDGDDKIFGFWGKDTLSGAGGNDLIYGGLGRDTLNGDAGDDTLYGGWGKDVLNGGAGDDTLYGGWGKDLLTGGEGSDIFVLQRYGGKNTITDFDLNTDKLGLDRRLGMSQLRFSGEKVLFRGRAIAILEGVDTTLLTANNFESV